MEDYKKKYENALNATRKFKNDCPSLWDTKSNPFKGVFEELEESEDERIRKALIHYFSEQDGILTAINGNVSIGDILAWLEKQVEQKSQGKQKLFNNDKYQTVPVEILDRLYESEKELERLKQGEQKTVSKTEPIVEGLTTEFQKQVSHLIASVMDKEHEYTKGYVEWVAQSLLGYAKNERTSIDEIKPKFKVGDWVVSPNGVHWHIDSINNNRYEVSSTNGACADWPLDTDLYHLWTIQDAKDGDVLSYVTDEGDLWIMIYRSLYKPYEGHVHYHAVLVNDNFTDKGTCCICIDNLKPATKEQRDLLFSKMKEEGYEWDVEKKELKKIEQCENYHCCGEVDNEALQKTLQIWFDKGKCSGRDEVIFHPEKFGLQKQVGQKPAWSEEDEERLSDAVFFVREYQIPTRDKRLLNTAKEAEKWLKSLKERYTWKPSDEQIDGIECAIKTLQHQLNVGDKRLDSLYNDLKKLKG